MKLYLVWDGSYSDTELLGIYSTMEKAREAHEQFAADNDIEEREMDVMPDHPPGLTFWDVCMKKDGSLWHGRFSYATPSRAPADDAGESYLPQYDWTIDVAFPRKTDYVTFYVWARDSEHALKIANERRIQLIATNEWTDDYKAWTKRLREQREEKA
jgi:hypothetical protein